MKFGIVLTMKRVIGCLCVPAALAAVACAASNVAAAAQSNSGTAAAGVFAVMGSAKGCPALGNPGGNSGMRLVGIMSPADGVALSVAQITDAWYATNNFVKADYISDRLASVTELDKNGDGLLCIGMIWGQNLNPNSHWALFYGDLLDPAFTEKWAFSDNHMGTSHKD